ncbi:hypothetical protein Hamer_G025037 [Homarus americanus]|uniref:Uncharacterized protein n=1 Tax=Homarus americanus TaxID=6706 RepID=A0A8J5TN01_HOMAM|nr:hypothetical protein Hamer_G025037 [Homarus americanus]
MRTACGNGGSVYLDNRYQPLVLYTITSYSRPYTPTDRAASTMLLLLLESQGVVSHSRLYVTRTQRRQRV